MTIYRVLRDFGSHLGNHYRGEYLNLPDGPLPSGFAGFVEEANERRVVSYPTKVVRPASGRANDVPSDAGSPESPTPPETPPAPADRARDGYDDKMLRPANLGHGHVRPRPDGVKARCGGPGICTRCSQEKARLTQEAQP